ncbi:MAG: flagellar export protein FliJ [Acidothermaceae bacterium]
MKRYVFSLQRVLRVRATQETVARQALRSAADHAAYAADDYDMKTRNYEANVASAASLRGTVLNMLAMRDITAMRARAVLDAANERDTAQDELDTASAAWARAKQKLGALENLDERQRAEYQVKQEAAEQREADDLVNGRARRAPSGARRGDAS